MKKKSQKELILELLQEGGWVSATSLVEHAHSYRYSARIKDLREEGYVIEGRKKEGRSDD